MGLLTGLEEEFQFMLLVNRYGDPWASLSTYNNPFLIDERNKLFSELISELKIYSIVCSRTSFWELKSHSERKTAYDKLNKKRKEINILLKNLIPKGALNKKRNPNIRQLKLAPELLVLMVEPRKKKMSKLLKEYKKKYNEPRTDLIDRILRDELKYDPDKFNIEERSVTTITINIMAYILGVSFSTLYPIYNKIKKEKREDIIKNPSKYFPFFTKN